MRAVLLLVLLAGCADDGDPHVIGLCGDSTTWGRDRCEAACLSPRAQGASCIYIRDDGGRGTCGDPWSVNYDGTMGCCFPESDSSGEYMRFYKCVE